MCCPESGGREEETKFFVVLFWLMRNRIFSVRLLRHGEKEEK